jgi:uncharacterized Zn finger protein
MGYYRGHSGYGQWGRYVPVAERRREIEKHVQKQKKAGIELKSIVIDGRTIARTFWGKAWCENLESYSDYANRLPRGRTYVRNGSVIDLQISKGSITAQVMGSCVYRVQISIVPMAKELWKNLVGLCSGKIDSLIELLQGKFSSGVMAIVTERASGLFPKPREISMTCSCPDSAGMCKHIAATLYGVGALLDETPEHLFRLRQVDHTDLLAVASVEETLGSSAASSIDEADLSTLFGIDIDAPASGKKVVEQKSVRMTHGSKPKKAVRQKSAQVAKRTKSKKAVRQRSLLQTDSSAPKKAVRRKSDPSMGAKEPKEKRIPN